MKKGDLVENVKCSKYGIVGSHKFLKSWTIKGKGNVETQIEQFKCSNPDCRRKFRRGVPVNKEA